MKLASLNALRTARKERERDLIVREQLGLRYVGLWYPPHKWPSQPKQMYIGVSGATYIKVASCMYREVYT